MNKLEVRANRSTIVLAILHTIGIIGILSPYSKQFILLTPINLLVSAGILIYNHKRLKPQYYGYFALIFISAFVVEAVGVNTGVLFGNYEYGEALGPKLFGTPIVIGVNWLMLIISAGGVAYKIADTVFSQAILGAALMVGLDFLIEPVAMKVDFWDWANHEIPLQNYVMWFFVAFVLFLAAKLFDFKKSNAIAFNFYAIQLLFFLVLRFALQ